MKNPVGRPCQNYETLYHRLLHDLHHGVRSASCTLLGVLSLDIPAEEKLALMEPFVKALDAKTMEISAKQNELYGN